MSLIHGRTDGRTDRRADDVRNSVASELKREKPNWTVKEEQTLRQTSLFFSTQNFRRGFQEIVQVL